MSAKLVCLAAVAAVATLLPFRAMAVDPADSLAKHLQNTTVPVTVNNYVRAETAAQFDRILKMTGGVNKLMSFRAPTPLDKQSVIRMNRDTLYSFAVVDISEGATLTMPENDGRYNSAMIVNEDEYINKVFYDPGTYELTKDEFDTDHVLVAVRALVDSGDPADIKKANELQDQIVIEAASSKPYSPPNFDEASYKKLRELLLGVSTFMPDSTGAFGSEENTKQVPHLLGAAFGWGGLPSEDAFYLNVNPGLLVAAYHIEVPKEVPVEAFWSVSVYNKDGFFQENDKGVYNINSRSGEANPDGSMTVNLGGCDDVSRMNCIPLTEGWNYVIRMYRPAASVIDGTWSFPSVQESEK